MPSKRTTIEQLHEAIKMECRKLLGLSDKLNIELLPFDSQVTLDSTRQETYRVLENRKTAALVTLCTDSQNLAAKHSLMTEALPEATLNLYGSFRIEGVECVLSEYFDGNNLEEALDSGSISSDDAKTYALQIQDALESTTELSSKAALLQEIEDSFAAIRGCRVFNETDRKFLEDIIFPLLRPELEKTPLTTSLTNGDFIARNLLYSPSKGVKLIDYEFAKRTHFKWEDDERWKRFSSLEDHELRFMFETGEPLSPPKEIFFLLSQIALDANKMSPTAQKPVLKGQIERIIELASNLQPALGKSVFLNTSLATAHLEQDSQTTCQLFWDEGTLFTERNSQRDYLTLDERVTKSFAFEVGTRNSLTIRFDPCTTSGLIEIRKVRINDENQSTLYEAGNASGWEGVTTGGHAIALSYESQLLVLSTGPDPYIVFPKIALPSGSAGNKVRAHFEFVVKTSIEQSHKHLGKFAQFNKDLQKSGLLSELESLKQKTEHWQQETKRTESKLQESIDAKTRADQMIAAQEAQIKDLDDEFEKIKQKLHVKTLELARYETLAAEKEQQLQSLVSREKDLENNLEDAKTESAFIKSELAVEREKSSQAQKTADQHRQRYNRLEKDAERDANLWSNALKRLDLRLERERSKQESQTIQFQVEIEQLESLLNAVVHATGRKGKNALLAAQGKTQPSLFQRLFHTHADND